MKVALVGPTYPFRGGIAHYTTFLYQALTETHDVQLISFRRQYPSFLFPGKSDRETGQKLSELDVRYVLDPLNPLTWWKTARHLHRWQPHIVVIPWWVSFWGPAWLTITTLLRRQTTAKIIFICHNILPHEPQWWDAWLAKVVLSRGHACVVHAEVEKIRLLNLLPGAKVEVNPLPTYAHFRPNGLTPAEARAGLGLGQNDAVVLFFGLVRPYKGLDLLLEAAAQLRDTPPIKLMVVGEFWIPEADITAQIEMLGLRDQVMLVNRYVPNEDVAQYFLAADVVVLPYREATQSAVVQIAFGLERPVITSNVGGLAEAVQDGRTGYIVPPNDTGRLARAIERFFRLSPEDRHQFQQNIRQDVDRFAWSRLVETLERAGETTGHDDDN